MLAKDIQEFLVGLPDTYAEIPVALSMVRKGWFRRYIERYAILELYRDEQEAQTLLIFEPQQGVVAPGAPEEARVSVRSLLWRLRALPEEGEGDEVFGAHYLDLEQDARLARSLQGLIVLADACGRRLDLVLYGGEAVIGFWGRARLRLRDWFRGVFQFLTRYPDLTYPEAPTPNSHPAQSA